MPLKLFSINNKAFKNMKINYYSIYHWYFQFADLRELNPIYRVALLKVNGGK